MNLNEKILPLLRKKKRVLRTRKTLVGTKDRPRVSVFKSLRNIEVQIINDEENKTLLGLSTLSKEVKEKVKGKNKTEAAKILGEIVSKKATEIGIKKVCFDRRGNKFTGRIKSLAEALRAGGLEF